MQMLEHHTCHHSDSEQKTAQCRPKSLDMVPGLATLTSPGNTLEMQTLGPAESESLGEGPGIWILTSLSGDSENKGVRLEVTQCDSHIPPPTSQFCDLRAVTSPAQRIISLRVLCLDVSA